jgi:hypothetical protein
VSLENLWGHDLMRRSAYTTRFKIFICVLCALPAVYVIAFVKQVDDKYPQRLYAAANYIAPHGCDVSNPRPFTNIPLECDSESNRIDNFAELGFSKIHRGDDWIRIGNSALDVNCALFATCHVWRVLPNKFYQK